MKKKRRNIFSYVILSVWSLIIIGILGWVLMSSFKTNLEIYQTPWAMPAKATLENYHSAWSTMKMSSYFMNSVVIVFASILGCTVISALTSFALTRYEFKGRKALLNLLIFSMSVPSQLLLIPLYDQLLNLGLVNTPTRLILIYIALYFPFSLFVLTGFFRTLPKELEESAVIDGCGDAAVGAAGVDLHLGIQFCEHLE